MTTSRGPTSLLSYRALLPGQPPRPRVRGPWCCQYITTASDFIERVTQSSARAFPYNMRAQLSLTQAVK
jgi:hypothetical protein